jgi:hypothetical protein
MAWIRLKKKLHTLFAEGLDNYDVARPYEHCEAWITRPTLAEIEEGWKPTNAVHLEGEDAELREQQKMNDYYRYKSMLRYGR